jgi:hypothetical protein
VTIGVKQAVEAATAYAKDLFEPEITGIRLEELEHANEDGASVWRVTLSFYLPAQVITALERLVAQVAPTEGTRVERVYKTFVVDDLDGSVRSMRIRQIET